MKKLISQLALLLLPVFALAQKDAPLLKDFGKKIYGITSSVKFNDHTYAVAMVNDEENSELAAVDNKMNVLWRLPLKDKAYQVGKFKGNLLAYTVNEKGKQQTFTAFLIDPNTGKMLAQKVVYDSKTDYKEEIIPVFTEDGNVARLVSRESGVSKSGLFKSNNFNETKDLTVIDLDEKLGTTTSKPAIPDGNFISLAYNQLGDLFILDALNNNTIELSKYDNGKTAASSSIVQDMSIRNKGDANSASLILSKTDNNIAYMAFLHENKDKDRVLTLCKFDFNSKSAQVASTPFDKAHIKSLEKSFVPLNKKMDEPDMGSVDYMAVRHLEEYNGNLLVSISGHYQGTYQIGSASAAPNAANTGSTLESYALIIAGFDLKLQPKFEQALPVFYQYLHFLTDSYHGDGNYYDILASNTRHDKGVRYAQIDLATGKLVKFEMLTIDGKHLMDDEALWFKDGFIVPFSYLTGILPPHKLSVDLQLDSY